MSHSNMWNDSFLVKSLRSQLLSHLHEPVWMVVPPLCSKPPHNLPCIFPMTFQVFRTEKWKKTKVDLCCVWFCVPLIRLAHLIDYLLGPKPLQKLMFTASNKILLLPGYSTATDIQHSCHFIRAPDHPRFFVQGNISGMCCVDGHTITRHCFVEWWCSNSWILFRINKFHDSIWSSVVCKSPQDDHVICEWHIQLRGEGELDYECTDIFQNLEQSIWPSWSQVMLQPLLLMWINDTLFKWHGPCWSEGYWFCEENLDGFTFTIQKYALFHLSL